MDRALVTVALAAATLLAAAAHAQPGRGSPGGGWGPDGQYQRLYDPRTVETLEGEVESVERITPQAGMSAGVHLVLRTEKESISVHLGPEWYLANQDLKLEPKDRVEVKGSRLTLDGKPALIAAEVVKGDLVLKLRDEDGIPLWSGWRRRR